MTYKRLYFHLIKAVRESGWSVQHRKLAKYDLAHIDVENKRICIDKSICWKQKLLSLAHELGHLMQSRERKWKRFFSPIEFKRTKKNIEYVIAAERNASIRARKLLKKLGVKNPDYEELNPKYRKFLVIQYLNSYFEPEK